MEEISTGFQEAFWDLVPCLLTAAQDWMPFELPHTVVDHLYLQRNCEHGSVLS